ncbi:hypothetical protein OEA41_003698 [Lepraria neglecta]|uniref:MARVEL domain-containing protein n=1 Tax=Lepraria neglecta TaxID=209136 RepID=A0AAD9Z4R5_9LECA|nr:hypothetical protein OEA41_003698 [Lepraria neglecta]
MSILSNPKSLYGARIWQFGFAIGVLVLVSYAGVHRGWWPNINGALAVGVISAILTFAITLHAIISHHLNRNPFSGGSTMRTILRIAIEIIILLLWVATATLMLRPKNCFYRHVNGDGVDTCFANTHDAENDGGHPWTDQPTISWAVGIAFSFVEM